MEEHQNYFERLNSVDVNTHIEEKNGLKYLSWAWAWGEVKKRHPDAIYTIYENVNGWNYFTDGKTCWVKTGVTVNGVEHIEYLPIMDYRNKSILLDNVTSFDVNKTIQRSLTKACARHGLGLYIYAGEDLPEASDGLRDLTKEIANAKRKETINLKKEVEASLHTPKGAMFKYENAYAYVKKLNTINVNQKAVMDSINQTFELLREQGLENEYQKLKELVDSKMPKPDNDEIPY